MLSTLRSAGVSHQCNTKLSRGLVLVSVPQAVRWLACTLMAGRRSCRAALPLMPVSCLGGRLILADVCLCCMPSTLACAIASSSSSSSSSSQPFAGWHEMSPHDHLAPDAALVAWGVGRFCACIPSVCLCADSRCVSCLAPSPACVVLDLASQCHARPCFMLSGLRWVECGCWLMKMVVQGITGGVRAAKQGHKVIMTPTSHCYFDYRQSLRCRTNSTHPPKSCQQPRSKLELSKVPADGQHSCACG